MPVVVKLLEAAGQEVRDAKGDVQEAETTGGDLAEESAPVYEKEIKPTTEGWKGSAQTTLQSIFAVTQSIRAYPALSNVLFGDADWFRSWQAAADKSFARLTGSNWFASEFCERQYDITPSGGAVIRTAAGTYQAVANIQMERSERKSPLLCQRNPDPEGEEEFVCDRGQVCVDENFCYLDEDRDEEPDEDTPLEGFFYKITWGVSAPRDEALTPYIDENGIAVSFNVYVDTSANGDVDPGAVYMYQRGGDIRGPIELNNGDSDTDVIVHYSPNPYTEACIGWENAPSTMDRGWGSSTIGDVCFEVDISDVGEVNWGQSGRDAPSRTTTSSEVTRNSGW